MCVLAFGMFAIALPVDLRPLGQLAVDAQLAAARGGDVAGAGEETPRTRQLLKLGR